MNEDVDYDPWDDAPDEIDPEEIREQLHDSGIRSFPFDELVLHSKATCVR